MLVPFVGTSIKKQKSTNKMKYTISKLEAAKGQLVTAIQLFFEERDPVYIPSALDVDPGLLAAR